MAMGLDFGRRDSREAGGVWYRMAAELAEVVVCWLFGGVAEEDIGLGEFRVLVAGGVAIVGWHCLGGGMGAEREEVCCFELLGVGRCCIAGPFEKSWIARLGPIR